MGLLKKIFKEKTTRTGKGLTGLGITFAGFGLSMEFAPRELVEFVPDNWKGPVALASIVAGVILSLYGGSRVPKQDNKDK